MPEHHGTHAASQAIEAIARAALPTRHGEFVVAVFRVAGSPVEMLAVILGALDGPVPPLVRLHSECLTGDALGSLRCDCGEQLEEALALISAAGTGALLYLRQEGRGIGLGNKIRAYALQDEGLDTVDANTALGLPVDARRYATAAAVLRHLGVRRLRLLTNNPAKQEALEREGLVVVERVSLSITPNPYNLHYLAAKARRMGHLIEDPAGGDGRGPAGDPAVTAVPIAARRAHGKGADRPSVTVHYAQTLDGRIATRTGNSQWISGQDTLRFAHQLRASHDAVMIGVGTVVADDPRLTVRLVNGRSPTRIVVDSRLRMPPDANVLTDAAAPTIVAATAAADPERRRSLQASGVEVLLVDADSVGHVDLSKLLECLSARGISSVMIEGGARLITSALRSGAVDRLAVTIAPKVVGTGIEGVGDLGILRLSDAVTFKSARFRRLGDDIVFEGEVAPAATEAA